MDDLPRIRGDAKSDVSVHRIDFHREAPFMAARHRVRFLVLTLALSGSLSPGISLFSGEDREPSTTLTVDAVAKLLDDDGWVLVDTREPDAYNGWALDGVRRGGHIRGAVDFSARWLDVDHENRTEILEAALRTKGIERDRRIVLYSVNESDRRRVAEYLRSRGIHQLHEFDLRDWAGDESRPLIRYENFHLLVPPSIVQQLLEGQRPETFESARRIKFVEVSWGDEDASYARGHVPKSFHVNTDDFEPPPSWRLGDREVLEGFAARHGFQRDDTVIVSGEDPTASYRLAIVLRYMGVEDVRVLNGGFPAWKAAGYPVETERTPPPEASSFGGKIPMRPKLIDDIARVRAGLLKPEEFQLVDTRTWAEFIGKTSGYEYHTHRGRIPGSIYGQAGYTGPNSLTPYRNIDNTMRNAEEILALWRKSGIHASRHLSFLCGGGWRAAEVLTFARVIGIPSTSLYSDGWIGWSNDGNPTETGLPLEAPGPADPNQPREGSHRPHDSERRAR